MKKHTKTRFEIEAECLNCIWKGNVQAKKREHFLYWNCPRCGSRYCVTTPKRVEENESIAAEGLKAA
jgi:Zn finger protein HypA/HybF involved in hydrogenase expression